jgi:hypothetical protein
LINAASFGLGVTVTDTKPPELLGQLKRLGSHRPPLLAIGNGSLGF